MHTVSESLDLQLVINLQPSYQTAASWYHQQTGSMIIMLTSVLYHLYRLKTTGDQEQNPEEHHI